MSQLYEEAPAGDAEGRLERPEQGRAALPYAQPGHRDTSRPAADPAARSEAGEQDRTGELEGAPRGDTGRDDQWADDDSTLDRTPQPADEPAPPPNGTGEPAEPTGWIPKPLARPGDSRERRGTRAGPAA